MRKEATAVDDDKFSRKIVEEANQIIKDKQALDDDRLWVAVERLSQLTAQGKTVSDVLELLAPDDSIKAKVRSYLYFTKITGSLVGLERLGGLSKAQVDDLRMFLKEVTGI